MITALLHFHFFDLWNTKGVITRKGSILINAHLCRSYWVELWFRIFNTLIIRWLLGFLLRLSLGKRSLFSFTVNLPDDSHLHISSFTIVLILANVLETIRKVRYLSDLSRVRQEFVYTSWRLDLLRADRVRAFISPVKSLILWR